MRRPAATLVWGVCLVAWLGAGTPPLDRALGFLDPEIRITPQEKRELGDNRMIARVVPSPNDEVVVIGVTPVDVSASRLLHASGNIARLRRAPQVLAIGLLSTPPQASDLDALALDDEDLDSLRKCRPGDCDVKLADAEIRALRAAAEGAGWRDRLQRAFREAVLARVRAYLQGGLAAAPDTHSGSGTVNLEASFAAVLRGASCLTREAPALASYLAGPPAAAPPGVDWFLYWSKEKWAGKAVVRVAHVAMMSTAGASGPQAIVVEKQVFASHYIDALLGVTTLTSTGEGTPNYLVHVNRSKVDFLGGFLGPIKRTIARHKVEGALKKILALARARLESPH